MRRILFILGWSASLFADSSLYDTPLEDLLNFQVSTASKQVESFEHSAAVVDVLTQKEIEAYGAVTLAELLERMTSVYVTGTLPFPQGMLSIRGDVTAEQNNHVLVLLNGRPLRDSIYSGLNQDLYTAFPIQAIRQIEVIRGPGSVLYGTNAFVGVINLITREESTSLLETSVRYGSFNAKQVQTYFAKPLGEVNFSGAFSYFHNTGWDLTAKDWNNATTTSTTQSLQQYTRTTGGLLTAKYKNVTLNTYGDISEVPFISSDSSIPVWSLSGSEKIARITADLGYESELSSSWKTTLNATYNHLAATNSIPSSTNSASSDDLLLEWTHYLALSSKWNALMGATYSRQTGSAQHVQSNTRTIPWYAENVFSLYGQTTYQLLEPLRILGGAQVIKFSQADTSIVPRIAATYVLSSEWGVKALFSKAFRAPSQSERNLALIEPARPAPITVGNPGLTPETISTVDLQTYYQGKNYQLTATYFLSRQANLIHPVTTAGTPLYSNVGDENSTGVEVEARYLPHPNWTLQGNFAYQKSRNDQGSEDDGHVPPMMAKYGVSYQSDSYRVGLFHSFFQRPSQVDNGNGDTHDVNPRLNFYNNISLKVGLQLNQIFDWKTFPKTDVELYGQNLLGASVYYPEYVYGVINSFPGRSGRSVFGTLTMHF